MATKPRFRVGLVQMSMSAEPGENVEKAVARVAEAAGAGAEVVCLPELFRTPLLLPERGRGASSTSPSRCPARAPRRWSARARRRRASWSSPRSSSGARRALPQQRGRHRRRRARGRPLPEDAHPRRPALLREVLLHARRPRLSAPSTRPPGRIGTLICWDQWYPEGARLTALPGRGRPLLPDRHRLAPAGEGGARRRAARRLADDPARPRHRQRRLRGRRQPRRPREAARGRRRARVLGHVLRRRSLRGGRGRGRDRPEEILVVECDLRRIEEVRRNWPFLRDRRVDAYAGLERRFLDGS